jgi:hypothetical protein
MAREFLSEEPVHQPGHYRSDQQPGYQDQAKTKAAIHRPVQISAGLPAQALKLRLVLIHGPDERVQILPHGADFFGRKRVGF